MRRRMFLPQEEKGASLERLAGIFAAKEAVMKAIDLSAGHWLEIEISFQRDGKPSVRLSHPIPTSACALSVAHDGDYVIAFVVCVKP